MSDLRGKGHCLSRVFEFLERQQRFLPEDEALRVLQEGPLGFKVNYHFFPLPLRQSLWCPGQ